MSSDNYPPARKVTFGVVNSQPKPREARRLSYELDKVMALKTGPFKHRWSFGYNQRVPPLNLTCEDQTRILYTSSHYAFLLDYLTRSVVHLKAHKNEIAIITADKSGRWVATSDTGYDNVIVIWDTHTGMPVRALYNIYPNGCTLIQLSPCAKYLITVAEDGQTQYLGLWEWCKGDDIADSVIEITDFGKLLKVTFSDVHSNYFIITSKEQVCFMTFINQEILPHFPKVNDDIWDDMGEYSDATYISNTRLAASATNSGIVAIWSDIAFCEEDDDTIPISNEKNGIMQLQLHKCPITVICCVDNIIVTGDEKGMITFFDNRFRLLHWCASFKGDSIVSISFHLGQRAGSMQSEPESTHSIKTTGKIERQPVFDWECPFLTLHDASVEHKPFQVRDFIVVTASGRVTLVNAKQNLTKQLLHNFNANLTAISVHPTDPYLYIGTEFGKLYLFQYSKRTLLIDRQLSAHKKVKGEEQISSAISALQHSPNGKIIACGQKDGSVWILHPVLLQSTTSLPVYTASAEITKIAFSSNSALMAIADDSFSVSLFEIRGEQRHIGSYRCHSKTISDLVFVSNENITELYSISLDRLLVEFDIPMSLKKKELVMKGVNRIEQFGKPLGLTIYPEIPSTILICNSEYKYRVIQTSTKRCIRTAQGPIGEDPVCSIQNLDLSESFGVKHMIFGAGRHIGLQKLPVDGNPFGYFSVQATATKLIKYCHNRIGDLFTLGENSQNVNMWNIFALSVQILDNLGGKDLEPYYSLIEGGKEGTLMEDIKDYFIYAQIIHAGEFNLNRREVTNSITICELADVLRALGYFPSDYELENMIHELTHKAGSEEKLLEYRISFQELVKLYINYRHTFGTNEETLRGAFNTLALYDSSLNPSIERRQFINILEGAGEAFSRSETLQNINALMPVITDDPSLLVEEDMINNIPEHITYDIFKKEILGLVDPRESIIEKGEGESSHDIPTRDKKIMEKSTIVFPTRTSKRSSTPRGSVKFSRSASQLPDQ